MKQTYKPGLVPLAMAVLFALIATGCNTLRGIGQDTERAGEKIQEKASR